MTRPDLIELYLRLAREHWIPAVVVELTPEHIERFAAQGVPMPDDVIELLADYPLPKVDDLKLVPAAGSYDEKKAALVAQLNELQPGITQIALRPALPSEGLPRITADWQQRVWDAEPLLDDDVAAALRETGVAVTDWRDLMRRFEGGPEPAPAESRGESSAPSEEGQQ
ncbi:MAG: hypothetical protein DCC67_17620 [Planctomycetota bacterium]|nr:MAG: hypothetical protein DCC67_17620 [Planctomycetota bacterium]